MTGTKWQKAKRNVESDSGDRKKVEKRVWIKRKSLKRVIIDLQSCVFDDFV
jgi:hypothetical protein